MQCRCVQIGMIYSWCKSTKMTSYQMRFKTSMHSSRMLTACLLTVSQHALRRGGCVSQHTLGRGVSVQWGVPGVCGRPPPRDQRQTPLCEQNDWQTGLKTVPCRNFVAGVKIVFQTLARTLWLFRIRLSHFVSFTDLQLPSWLAVCSTKTCDHGFVLFEKYTSKTW